MCVYICVYVNILAAMDALNSNVYTRQHVCCMHARLTPRKSALSGLICEMSPANMFAVCIHTDI